MRTVMAVGVCCVVSLAACRSSPRPASVARPPAREVTAPHHFAEPTFIESYANGGVAVARLDDGKIVQVLAPASRPNALRIAMRELNGSLLVEACEPNCGNRGPDYRYAPYFRDAGTGRAYAGDSAALSPDRSRIATLVSTRNRQPLIRQYDIATGRVLSDLVAGVGGGYGSVLGFAWTADSRSLVVAVAPRTGNVGGLYVVDRAAHRLPPRPSVPNTVPGRPFAEPEAYASPAVLADGHILAFQYSYPIQRPAWPGALVDIDLRAGTRHTVLGTPAASDRPRCDATSSVTATGHPCETLVEGAAIAARGDQALVTLPGESQVWLFNGRTLRMVTTIPGITAANW